MTTLPGQNETNITTSKKFKGAPDYDDAAYWDNKFVTGQGPGEWLNEGTMLIDAAIIELEKRYSNCNVAEGISQKQASLPRALHLGPGISSLGDKLCDAFVRRDWRGSDIVVCQMLLIHSCVFNNSSICVCRN